MDILGWDSCDIIIVTGDAYVDHPSFGMAVIGRTLEAQGFRVGIISQPNWQTKEDFMALGEPNLFFGVTAGNMDSMINRYTADRKLRHDDAYTPNNEGVKDLIVLSWCILNVVEKLTNRHPSCSEALKQVYAAWLTTITGQTKFVALCCVMQKPISYYLVTRNVH